jgi:hypothetical protein
VEVWLAAIEQWQVASFFRSSRWGYAALNASHIAGLAMLVGASMPLALRLVGAWPRVDRGQLARVLVPVAALGLVIAVTTGLLLFSIRAREYASLTVFQIKLGLIVLATTSAVAAHLRHGLWLDRNPGARLISVGAVSLVCWFGALVCGRLIAFAV